MLRSNRIVWFFILFVLLLFFSELSGSLASLSATTHDNNSFPWTVPTVAPLGAQLESVIEAVYNSQTRETPIISLSDTAAVPNQSLTITGSGFSPGSDVVICQHGITIGATAADISPNSIDGIGAPCGDAESFIEVTAAGSFLVSVTIPIDLVTFEGATVQVNVVEKAKAGLEATTLLEIKKRNITVTPRISRPLSDLALMGNGFPADHKIEFVYDCEVATSTGDIFTDLLGRFATILRVPARCPIPSISDIVATTSLANIQNPPIIVQHFVPEAIVELNLSNGPPGTLITITGKGFRAFTSLEAITLGGLGVLGGRTINTDRNGDLSAGDFLIPALEEGVHEVLVEVGTGGLRTVASTTFEITAQPSFTPTPRPTPTPALVGPLLQTVVAPASSTFQAIAGGGNPPPGLFTIENGGRGTLEWSLTTQAPWLSVSPVSGTLTVEVDQVTLFVDISELPRGNYAANVIIAAPGASNSP